MAGHEARAASGVEQVAGSLSGETEGCALQTEKPPGDTVTPRWLKPWDNVKYQAARGQLDYELAVRDQSVVGSLRSVPR